MRVAALDLGSNTSLLLVAEVTGGEIRKVLLDETTVTKMGQGVHQSRRFHPDALARVESTLTRYRKLIDESKVEKVAAVATSAARDVANREALIQIGARLNIPIDIVSGDREARMTFLGAVSDVPDRDGVAVIDVGGGSTELIVQNHNSLAAVSVDVGSVRLTELFVTGHPIDPIESKKAADYAAEKFVAGVPGLKGFRSRRVIGVAGTPTTLAALEWNEPFSEKRTHGFRLTLAMVEKWIQTLAPLTIAEREKFAGMQPQRADVIVMGCVALRAAMQSLKCDELTVSVRGIRYGLALEMVQ